jgi:probable F420-dependent oxidoreductase
VPEHTHIPASRKSPWPGGGPLPKEYWHSHDPFVGLAMAAAVTKKIKLGTGICLVIERDPITLAKEVASLDFLSRGRFLFGIGGGWNAEEMEHHGTAFKTRWHVLRERILAMKELWTKEEAEFHGTHVKFEKSWAYPKPVQKPHPPILMGGDGPTTIDRVLEFCDGWMPIAARMANGAEKIATLQRRAKEMGRGPIPVTAHPRLATRRGRCTRHPHLREHRCGQMLMLQRGVALRQPPVHASKTGMAVCDHRPHAELDGQCPSLVEPRFRASCVHSCRGLRANP